MCKTNTIFLLKKCEVVLASEDIIATRKEISIQQTPTTSNKAQCVPKKISHGPFPTGIRGDNNTKLKGMLSLRFPEGPWLLCERYPRRFNAKVRNIFMRVVPSIQGALDSSIKAKNMEEIKVILERTFMNI